MSDNNIHAMWTEDELDGALADLHAATTATSNLRDARAALYAEIEYEETGHPQGSEVIHNEPAAGGKRWTKPIGSKRAAPPERAGAVRRALLRRSASRDGGDLTGGGQSLGGQESLAGKGSRGGTGSLGSGNARGDGDSVAGSRGGGAVGNARGDGDSVGGSRGGGDLVAGPGRDSSVGARPGNKPAGRRRRYLLAGSVVVLVVAAVLVGQDLLPGTQTPTASAASLTLRQAANATIHEQDQPLGPGQYRYIRSDAWAIDAIMTTGSHYLAFQAEDISELWVPRDQAGIWLERTAPTGKRVWVIGTEAEAEAAGFKPGDFDGVPSGDLTAACGDFYPNNGARPSCADMATMAGWQQPTPAWLATLPTDPQAMLARLRKDAPVNGRGDAELVVYVADALRSGLVPADVRALLYQALALLPDIKITQQVANLAGRTGVAMGVDDSESPTRQEIIIDPVTGQYIGERTMALQATQGVRAGAPTEYSSVTTAVVNAIGTRPAN